MESFPMSRFVPLAVLLLASGAALAQRPPGGNPMQHPPHAPFVRPGEGAPAHGFGELGDTDRNFIAHAARSGLAEIAAARLALQRTRNPALRDYAQRLMQDHAAANARLQRIAASKGVALPAGPSKKQQGDLRQLQRVRAKDFEQRFLRQMVDDHQKAIDLFGHEIKGRHQDADLKNFAQQTLIGLERHLAEAQRLRKAAGHWPGA
jgi:putative membrane protein